MGAGVVGTALAARLVRAGVPVIGLHGRQVDLSDAARAISGVVASTGDIPDIMSESDVVIISVRDERVPEVATRLVKEGRLRPSQVLLHTSGANAARAILAPALSSSGMSAGSACSWGTPALTSSDCAMSASATT